jgi:hypothetical protein
MPTAPTSGVVNKKRIKAQKTKKPYGQEAMKAPKAMKPIAKKKKK